MSAYVLGQRLVSEAEPELAIGSARVRLDALRIIFSGPETARA